MSKIEYSRVRVNNLKRANIHFEINILLTYLLTYYTFSSRKVSSTQCMYRPGAQDGYSCEEGQKV